MIIVADDQIPLVDYYFGSLGDLILKPGRSITKKDIQDADILLIRTVNQVNQDLLAQSSTNKLLLLKNIYRVMNFQQSKRSILKSEKTTSGSRNNMKLKKR